MRFSRLHCKTCREETLHGGIKCVHCGTSQQYESMKPKDEPLSGFMGNGWAVKGADESNRRGGLTSSGRRNVEIKP